MHSLGRKTVAIVLGASIAVAAVAAAAPLDLVRVWNAYRVERDRPHAAHLREEILTSLKDAPSKEWCGSYRWTNGFEERCLDVGPSGFYYEVSDCDGTAEVAYGRVLNVEGMKMRLETMNHITVSRLTSREGRRERFRFSSELLIVSWGRERFLVPLELMKEFCSLATATGPNSMKYADYPYKIALGGSAWDQPTALDGLPDVPAKFQVYLPR